jgi:hypothetical protein
MYNKAHVLGLWNFLQDKFAIWASNGRCAEYVGNNFRAIIHERIERFVSHKILRKILTVNTTVEE